MRDEYNIDKVYSIDEIKVLSDGVLKKLRSIDRVYLFGSYARNEATKDSDLDFLIFLENDNLSSLEEYVEASGALNFAFRKEIDVLLPKDIEERPYLKASIERDRVLIYERKN